MTDPTDHPAGLERLLELLDAGTIQAEDFHRLQELLEADPAARRIYRDYFDLRALLIWRLRGPDDVTAVPLSGLPANSRTMSDPAPTGLLADFKPTAAVGRWLPSLFNGEFTVGSLVVFVVVAAVFGVVAYTWQYRSTAQRDSWVADNAARKPAAEIGSLTTREVARLAASAVVRTGNRYELASGTASIVLARGTRLAIEGPAAWKFTSDERMELELGALAAHVPDQAVGFTVATPTVEIVDLGTDFSVVVSSDDDSKLSVTRGAVKVLMRKAADDKHSENQSEPTRVVAGQAVTISRSDTKGTVLRYAPADTNWAPHLSEQLEGEPAPRPTTIAYQASPDGARGNHFDFRGGVGFDFTVTRPIRVLRLGVFDHLGDGIDPESDLTVQLCSRNTQQSEDPGDDTCDKVLAEAVLSAKSAGPLKAGHRFVSLREPLLLAPGSYTILAYGFSERNPLFACILPPTEQDGDLIGTPQCDVATSRFAIVPGRVRADHRILPGTFPQPLEPDNMAHAAGTFEFEEAE